MGLLRESSCNSHANLELRAFSVIYVAIAGETCNVAKFPCPHVTEAAITTQNLVKIYRARSSTPVTALNGISVSVRRGEIFGLLGRNGAGKTTLLRVLTTLTQPTSGHVSVLGYDVLKEPLNVRKSICVVLQENAVELYLSVMDNLDVYARFHSVPRDVFKRRVKDVVEQFGLGEYLNQKVIDLSGGLKRRVQVAKVMLVDRPIVFLDEATTGMDPINKRTTIAAIREEARQGRTIFLTTHILQEAEELCDSITMIDRGRVVAQGDLQTIKALATNAYEIVLTFESITDGIVQELQSVSPLKMEQRNNTIELCIQGDELSALEAITRVARKAKLLHFEVNSATLEDVFLELLGDRRDNPSGRSSSQPAQEVSAR
jgi:ABC-2 type transport system ATP-binding protein